MLVKLIKHDFISLFKRIGLSWIIFGILGLFTVLVGLLSSGDFNNRLILPCILATSICIFGFTFSGLFSSFGWFQTKMFSNQGYLTHTLPAKTGTIILSKIITTFLLSLIGFLLALLSSFIISSVVLSKIMDNLYKDLPFLFSTIIKYLQEIFTELGLKLALSQFLSMLSFILTAYLSISIAQFFHSSRRSLMAVIYFILISIIFSTISYYGLEPFRTKIVLDNAFSPAQFSESMNNSFLLSYIFNAIKIVILWFGTMWICSKHLNLKN